ncbi:MAG: hypothetical protein MUF25_21805 [Pirellulaceae bacterium]|nr:hypothetical protein [Pirellulaceae bacterium]
MDPPRSVSLSELAGRVEIEAGYFVELPDTESLVFVAGGNYPAAATRYDHANVAAKQDKVFLTRSYLPDGRKRWIQHAGRDFYFVIPRSRIALVFAKGYSFVPVLVNGQTLHLNVSGGTCGDGWSDFVRQQVSVGIGFSKQKLDLLAEVALPPAEARSKVSLELTDLSERDVANFVELLAGQMCRSRLESGRKLVLQDGWSFAGSRGPFVVESKATRQRYYIARADDRRSCFKAPYKAIDWAATAVANEFAVPRPVLENRVEPVMPYVAPLAEAV